MHPTNLNLFVSIRCIHCHGRPVCCQRSALSLFHHLGSHVHMLVVTKLMYSLNDIVCSATDDKHTVPLREATCWTSHEYESADLMHDVRF